MRAQPTDVGSLRERLTSIDGQIRIIGLGEGGLIALGFGDLTSQIGTDAPRPLLAAFITLIVIAGGLLARVWIAAHVAAQRLVSPQELSSTLDLTSGVPKIALTEYRLSRRLLWLALTAMELGGQPLHTLGLVVGTHRLTRCLRPYRLPRHWRPPGARPVRRDVLDDVLGVSADTTDERRRECRRLLGDR